MISSLQIYIFLTAITAAFSFGVYFEHKVNVASTVGALYDEITATKAGQELAESIAAGATAKTDQLTSESDLTRNKLYEEIAKNPSNCPLPIATIELLRDTAKAANRAAGGND